MDPKNIEARRLWAACGLAFLALFLLGAGAVVNDTYQYLPVVYRIDPTPTNTIPSGPPWLIYLNQLRALGGLPPVTENSSWSEGGWYHSRYCVKNNTITHEETVGNLWYTAAGNAAGMNGNVMVTTDYNNSDNAAIDGWMIAPFHGVGMIAPDLLVTGFGAYRENIGDWSRIKYAATLDVLRGRGAVPASVSFPVRWPGSGASMPYTEFDGSEWPDPLTSCSGYSAPSGPPIYLLLGPGNVVPSVTSHSFTRVSDGQALQHCIFDQTTYSGDQQSLVRSILDGRNAIILMPRNTLTRGAAYTVSVTTNGQTYTWSFTVASANGPEPLAAPRIVK